MRHVVLLAAVALTGCQQILGLDVPSLAPSDAATDTVDDAVDAAPCASAGTTCAGENFLQICEEAGNSPSFVPCPWGCGQTAAGDACLRLQPAGGALTAEDLDETDGLKALAIPDSGLGKWTIDTDTGQISHTFGDLRPSGTGIRAGIDYQQRDGVGVFRASELSVTGPVRVRGTRALAIVSLGDIEIDALLDLRGTCAGVTAGPGGSPGGAARTNAAGAWGGRGGGAQQNGGGGGGHGGLGGHGGPFTTSSAGGSTRGDATITVLVGGGGGGGGGELESQDGIGGAGGGGGGAVQLVSNAQITISPNGAINAGGCAGRPAAAYYAGGGGGGAGGTILLEAPEVTIDGALAVNGGGGGTGHEGGSAGAPGDLSRLPASGGVSASDPNGAKGGDGAAGADPHGQDGEPGLGGFAGGGGGGGGAIGRIRVNTRHGAATVGAGALMSPAFSDASTATQGKGTVQ